MGVLKARSLCLGLCFLLQVLARDLSLGWGTQTLPSSTALCPLCGHNFMILPSAKRAQLPSMHSSMTKS